MKNWHIITILAVGFIALSCYGQTNIITSSPSSDSAEDTFNWLVNWNNKLLGAPTGVLVLVILFLFDSVLYYAEFFRNRNIPVFSIVCGGIIYCLLSVKGDAPLPMRVWIAKNVVLGCIIGCIAWIASLRYGMKLVGAMAGRPDPSPPLPEKAPAPTKIELEVTGAKTPSVTISAEAKDEPKP